MLNAESDNELTERAWGMMYQNFVRPKASKQSGMKIFLQDHHFSLLVNIVLLFFIVVAVILFYFQERHLTVVIIRGFTLRQLVIQIVVNSS